MKMVTLLKKINSDEIKNGTVFHGGDLFYKMILIDKNLYLINEISKQLELFDSKHIGDFIANNYDIYEYKKVLE